MKITHAILVLIAAFVLTRSAEAESIGLNGQDTVVISYDTYAHEYLQYFLIRCVAKHPDAASFLPHIKPAPDRSKAPAFPIVREIPPDKNAIVIGSAERIPDNWLAAEDKKRMEAERRGAILLKRSGKVVVLAHIGGPWYFAHINTFLDRLAGVRMYAPNGADGLHWVSEPEFNAITVGELDLLRTPFFAKATYSTAGHERNRFWLRFSTILSEQITPRATHGIIQFFEPEKYHATHPQLFPMTKNGTRPRPIGDAWNPCLADPELAARVAMETVREKQKSNRHGYLSFGVMDCHYECHCDTCQASLKKHGDNAANLWYDFLNRVAVRCQKEFPGLYLTSYDYVNVGIPTGMTIEPNIVVDNVIKTYQFTDREKWDAQRRQLMAFAGLGASWVAHDWNFTGVTPRIYSRRLASFLQWGAQNGMLGLYTEWSSREYWYLNGAKYWITRQLQSDPYQDTDALWRQYCQDMFGDGWVSMYRFYDMFQQKHVVSGAFHIRQDWPRQEAAAFAEADVAQQRRWLEDAIDRTADDPMIQKRLAAVMRYFRAHELLVIAVAKPARLYHQHTVLNQQTGINREALAFYVNDDGKKLLDFEHYYNNSRTLAPDSNAEDANSSMRFSYRNNYSRALGTIIQAVNREAMKGVDLEGATEDTIAEIRKRASQIYQANLPAEYDKSRAEDVRALMDKIIWVPHGAELPVFDGDLNDKVWKSAATLDGWTQADLLLPTTERNKTEGKIIRIGNHLVFGLVCHQPRGIWAETPAEIETGTRIWRESGVEFFIGPPVQDGDEQEFAQYIVNALGAFRGFRKAKDNRTDVHHAVRISDDRKSYTVEIAIPLHVKGLYDYSQTKVFSFNIMRNPFYADTFNSSERIGWAPIFFTASKPESRGTLVVE